jgi:hypothetical protein
MLELKDASDPMGVADVRAQGVGEDALMDLVSVGGMLSPARPSHLNR